MPFQPGQSGNPAGSKRARDFGDAIRKEIAQLEDGDYEKGCRRLARKWVRKADGEDQAALESLITRIDGKPAQQVQLTGADDGPVQFTQVIRKVIGA